jgi:DNA-binding transcriptional LysR family regulator
MHPPPPAIELRHLRYFLAVVDELHFGRAAERLHIAQPPLSQAIRRLEEELGVQLFNRTSRVVTLTEAGGALATQAAIVLASFNVAVAETRRAGGMGDVLRVACVPHLPLPFLQTFLEALDEAESAVHPQVTHLRFTDQVQRLHDAELDIGIFRDVGEIDRLEVEPLFAGEALGVFVRKGHPLGERGAVGPEDLRSETLLTGPRSPSPAPIDQFLRILEDAGFEFVAVHEANSEHAKDLLLAVADGLGVAIAPASLASISEAGALVSWRPLAPRVSMPQTVVAWRANPPAHLSAVLASVRDVARRLRSAALPTNGQVRTPFRRSVS